MKAFLLTWNPHKQWAGDPRDGGRWSTGNRASGIRVGDRLYLVRQGAKRDQRGIVAVGKASWEIREDDAWRDDRETDHFVGVYWCPLTRLVSADELERIAPSVMWDNLYRSGVEVKVASEVQALDKAVRRLIPPIPLG